jgi:hypothetical protein
VATAFIFVRERAWWAGYRRVGFLPARSGTARGIQGHIEPMDDRVVPFRGSSPVRPRQAGQRRAPRRGPSPDRTRNCGRIALPVDRLGAYWDPGAERAPQRRRPCSGAGRIHHRVAEKTCANSRHRSPPLRCTVLARFGRSTPPATQGTGMARPGSRTVTAARRPSAAGISRTAFPPCRTSRRGSGWSSGTMPEQVAHLELKPCPPRTTLRPCPPRLACR